VGPDLHDAWNVVVKAKHGLAVHKKLAKNAKTSENERDSTAI